jgi:hypothetical protein
VKRSSGPTDSWGTFIGHYAPLIILIVAYFLHIQINILFAFFLINNALYSKIKSGGFIGIPLYSNMYIKYFILYVE